jgi:flagellar basal-body rod protein FlgB
VANNDTPRFKKFAVNFEDSLRAAVHNYRNTGNLDLSRAVPVAQRIHTNLNSRIDGNNVDINEESALMYRNSVIFDMLVNSLMANRQLHSIVRQGIR